MNRRSFLAAIAGAVAVPVNAVAGMFGKGVAVGMPVTVTYDADEYVAVLRDQTADYGAALDRALENWEPGSFPLPGSGMTPDEFRELAFDHDPTPAPADEWTLWEPSEPQYCEALTEEPAHG